MAFIKRTHKILILDPVSTNRKIYGKLLEKEGHKVFEAKTLAEALAVLDQQPQLKVMITNLENEPFRSGVMMQAIRNIQPQLPVIILTGQADSLTIMSIFEQGFENFLTMPLDPRLFLDAVNSAIDSRLDFFGLCKHLNLFNDFSVPIYMADKDRRLVYANQAFSALFGIPANALRQHPLCCDILGYNVCKTECICTQPLSSGKNFKVRELQSNLADRKLNLFASFMPVFDILDKVAGVLVSLADLSSEADLQGNFKELYEKEKEKTIALEKAQNQLALEKAHVEELNRTLEQKVEQRTEELRQSKQEIKEVLDHIDLAIMTFAQDGRLSEGYSRASCDIFGGGELAGATIYNVIGLKPEEERYVELKNWIELSFQVYGVLKWEEIVPLSPLREWNVGKRHILTSWIPIEKNGSLERLMMINRDTTVQKKLEEQIALERAERNREMETLSQLLANPQEELAPYFRELTEKTSTLEDLIRSNLLDNQDRVSMAYRSAHTIKGGSALYKFSEICELAHALEDQLEGIRKRREKPSPDVMAGLLKSFEAMKACADNLLHWAGRLNIYSESTGAEKRTVKVQADEILDLIALLESHLHELKGPSQRQKLADEVEYWRKKATIDCETYFRRFDRILRQVAERVDKQVHPLVIKGGTVRLLPEYAERWVDPLNHLLRNAIDHGVELPDVRKTRGKNPMATVSLNFAIDGEHLTITAEDDGGGINTDKVLEKARQSGFKSEKPLTEQQKMELIFMPGLSTAEAVTDISGRGVGMDIVKTMIDGMGGSIRVESAPKQGTRFILKAPLKV